MLDLALTLDLEQDAVVDQHAWRDADLAQPLCRQPQHVGASRLHWEVVERALVGAGGQTQRPPEYALDPPRQHRSLGLVVAPPRKPRIGTPVALDEVAGDDGMPVQTCSQR